MSIAVVTGGAGGIGLAAGRALGAAGHVIAIVDNDVARSDDAERILDGEGITAFSVPTDVTDVAEIERMAAAVMARGDVAVVVNNAGHALAASFDSADPDDWRRSLVLNLDSAYHVSRVFLPGLKARREGVIVNVSSVNGLGTFGNPAYSVAKAGMIHLTHQLAVEYGPFGIRAVTVVPGTVRTPAWAERLAADPHILDEVAQHYPLRRVAEPQDVAAVIAFVASDAARAITGSEILVDCGLMAGSGQIGSVVTRHDR